MEWDNSKSNWKSDDTFGKSDYNRIKNNIMYVHYLAIRGYHDFDIADMGENKGWFDYFYADEINKMLDNIEKINKNTVDIDLGPKLTYRDNGPTMTWKELNKIEGNLERLWFRIGTRFLDREVINIEVSIDKPATFTSALITCVDIDDSGQRMTVKVTKSREVGFSVIAGHRYYIAFTDVEGFKTPDVVKPTIARKGNTLNLSASYLYDEQAFRATINVTCPNGATLTCAKDFKEYTQANTNGQHSFIVYESGTWTITIKNGSLSTSTSVYVATSGQTVEVEMSFPKIYGISRRDDSTSSSWSRTDDAVGKTAKASETGSSGHSDFNNCYPWSEMKRRTFKSGDVMVKIPEFWYKRYSENDIEYIQIADKPAEGFEKHPGSGCFVGAYKTSGDFTSVSGVNPTNTSRTDARNSAKKKGYGWGIIDIATISAIQMLYLVEFADNDSQRTIGMGVGSYHNNRLTGTCDNIPGLTGSSIRVIAEDDVVYRGVEGLWGNYSEWVDGLNIKGKDYYISINRDGYTDHTDNGYTKINYRAPKYTGCISRMGVDERFPWAILPAELNLSTDAGQYYYHGYYYNDECVSGDDGETWYISSRGGHVVDKGDKQGLFYFDFSRGYYNASCRLLYKP